MPLSDVEIQAARASGDIRITPFDEKMLQPASYDLKVGKKAATVPKNGEPRLDLEEEGVLLIAPYAPAGVFTKEELQLSTSYVGHFGLNSTFARRGLMASIGMQIDPGFEGPLSVTLINMTPNPISLNYGETFVTLEFERLSVPASKGYNGKYQRRKTFLAEELDPMIGFKGHALTDVVKGFQDIRDAVKGVAQMSQKLDTFLDQHRQEIHDAQRFNKNLMADMKALVEHIVGGKSSTMVVRQVSHDQARREILELFQSSGGPLFYSDICERLQLDLEQVLEITTELEREGLIGEGKGNG